MSTRIQRLSAWGRASTTPRTTAALISRFDILGTPADADFAIAKRSRRQRPALAAFVVDGGRCVGHSQRQGFAQTEGTVKEMAKKLGMTVKDVQWTLGQYDIVHILKAKALAGWAKSANKQCALLGRPK